MRALRTLAKLDLAARHVTAWSTFAELELACRAGHTPSLRRTCADQAAIGDALERDGLRVFWG